MSNDILLSTFCAICHVNAIKYTCPRCGIHTCSLPCVKKHKARAQCSGIRDPAEYRKRSELASASSIDKDFNFITNVERSISKADDNVLDRGLHLQPARQLRPSNVRPKIDIEVEERGVKVIRAPKGLSRSKHNKTHWVNQQKSIMWTTEWICIDGEKVVGQCLETRSVGEAYITVVGKKKIQKKRKLSQQTFANGAPVIKKALKQAQPEARVHAVFADDSSKDSASNPPGQQSLVKTEQVNTGQQPLLDLLAGTHLYLYNPTTSSKFKCLMPLSPEQSFQEALRRRTVLEFPTFYVLKESPTELRAPYITQEEYDKRHGDDIPINLNAPLEDGEVEETKEEALPASMLPEQVLEVLAQDLAG